MTMKKLRRSNVFLNFLKKLIIDYRVPGKINYFWNFGAILGVVLVFQMMSGILLSLVYNSEISTAFSTVDLINRDLWGGWVSRFIHLAGAKSFFLFLYLHMGRGVYYLSYVHNLKAWLSGCTIFILSMAMAFLGYVLPWGQMSYWGATVITNFFSMIPFYGMDLVIWLWGGYAVDYPTLTRFFSLHYLLPFVLMALVMVHLMVIHENGASCTLGIMKNNDCIEFHPYFIIKDLFSFGVVFFVSYYLFFFNPDLFMESEKYIEANPLMTPVHIQPEWYFLSAYAILRSIPKKFGGVLALMCFIVVLYLLPVFSSKKNIYSNFNQQMFFWSFSANFVLLTWLGACPVESPYMNLARVSSLLYFLYFLKFINSLK